jgi:serine/threonine protein kinase
MTIRSHAPEDVPRFSVRPEYIKKFTINEHTVLTVDDVENHPLGFGILPQRDGRTPPIYLRASSVEEKQAWIDTFGSLCAIARRFASVEKKRVIGVGGQGIVYEAVVKDLNITIAMKEIEIKSERQMKSALAEANMLKDIMEHVAHPNIIAIKKIIHFGPKFYLIFPLCTGGELLEHIVRQRHFKEHHALKITRDIVSALDSLHAHNILHLDIKPENILFESQEPDAEIKLTDFGLSRLFSDVSSKQQQQAMPTSAELVEKRKQFIDLGLYANDSITGTIGYMSPELILTGYVSAAADVFAAGVVLYIMLCGDRPFTSRSNRQTFLKTITGSYRMDTPEWQSVSTETKDLVKRMLDVDPATRITTTEILQLPLSPAAPYYSDGDEKKSANMTNLIKELKAEKMVQGMAMMNEPKKTEPSLTIGMMPDMHSDLATTFLTSFQSESLKNPWNNERTRLGLKGACNRMGDELGRLTILQYLGIYRKCGLGGVRQPVADCVEDVALALLLSFVDSDGDGLITANDVLTANSLIANRHEIFLGVLFAIYVESLPNSCGQPSALLPQLLTGHVLRKTIASKALKVNNFDASEDFSPPHSSAHHLLERQCITSEHVAYIFQKYGHSSEIGRKVFDALFDILLISGSQRSKYDPDVPAEEEEEEEQQLPESKDSEKAPQRRIFLDQFIGRLGLLISCSVCLSLYLFLSQNIHPQS